MWSVSVRPTILRLSFGPATTCSLQYVYQFRHLTIWGWVPLCCSVRLQFCCNSSDVTLIYNSFLKGTTQFYKNDDVLTILKSLTMTTLSVADGSYTNLVNFFHHFFAVRTGFEPVINHLHMERFLTRHLTIWGWEPLCWYLLPGMVYGFIVLPFRYYT